MTLISSDEDDRDRSPTDRTATDDQVATDPARVATKDYWEHNWIGTHNRPRPGTQVRIVSGPHLGHTGTVALYEGCWNSPLFPVQIDHVGVTALYTTSCVRQLPYVPTQSAKPEKRRAHGRAAVVVAS